MDTQKLGYQLVHDSLDRRCFAGSYLRELENDGCCSQIHVRY